MISIDDVIFDKEAYSSYYFENSLLKRIESSIITRWFYL